MAEWDVIFYTEGEQCPVKEFIGSLTKRDKAAVAHHLDLLRQFGILLTSPYVSKVTGHDDLWELRPRSTRLFYFAYTGRQFIILHAFRKKGQKTPPKEIETAERRMKRFLEEAK